MNVFIWRVAVIVIAVFPGLACGCCSSPLAETVFIGTVVSVESVETGEGVVYHVGVKKHENFFGDALDEHSFEIHEVALANAYKVKVNVGDDYLITLYDVGKHDVNGKLLPGVEWEESRLVPHPFIGVLPINSFRAVMVKKYTSYYGGLEWTMDFKLINIFFLQE